MWRIRDMHEVDIPGVLAELAARFEAYETALVDNDIDAVNDLFWNSSATVRYGTRENECHYGCIEIASFRRLRGAVNQERILKNTRITTFGNDFGITNTEFQTAASDKVGRQSQTWFGTEQGWRIVSAHVSFGL